MPGSSLGINLDDVTTGLVVGSGGTTSPAWANNLRTIVQAIIDDIEAKIVSSEISLDAALEFNNYRATELAGCQFQNLTTQPAGGSDVGLLYEYQGDLWYNDASANQVRVTLNGAVDISSTGQITGMSGSASVAYTGGGTDAYTFLDHNGYPAALVTGPLRVKEQAAAISNAVSLQSPSSLGAAYNWIYPTALPSSGTEVVTVSSTGQLDTTADLSVTTILTSGVGTFSSGVKVRSGGNGDEILDSFQDVGTYTPVFKVSGVTQSPDTILGSYCRIGSWVMGSITIVSATVDYPGGRFTVTLPYDADITTNQTAWAGCVGQCIVANTARPNAACLIDSQSTDDPDGNVVILENKGSTINTVWANPAATAFSIKLSICYLTDAAAD